jgi:hypothetical protein
MHGWRTSNPMVAQRSKDVHADNSNESGPPFGMRNGLEAMIVAVRVLTSLNEKRLPEHPDLQYLREHVPLWRHLPADELACEVIQQALGERARRREAELRRLSSPHVSL